MITGIRILLVDDHNVVRSSIGMMLEANGALIVGEASDGQDAIAQALQHRPDVVIMDITLPDINGIEATRQICESWQEAKILALTMHNEEDYLVPFLDAGGLGYVQKSAADREVIQAIETILQGDHYIASQGIRSLVNRQRLNQSPGEIGLALLTDRERSVLEFTVRGYTSREIGEQLNLSPHTIDTYRARLMEKLGMMHRHELVDFAIKHHILD